MESEAVTGYEHLLDDLDNDEGFETPKVKASIDEFWGGRNTKEGDEIRGIFLEKREFDGRNNKKFSSIILLTKQGVYGVTENKFLGSRLTNLKEGDGLKLVYTGKAPTKDGNNEYNTYDVQIKKFTPDAPEAGHESQMMMSDDSAARTTIEIIRKEIGQNTSPEQVLDYIKKNRENLDLNDEHITRIKAQLAKEIQGK